MFQVGVKAAVVAWEKVSFYHLFFAEIYFIMIILLWQLTAMSVFHVSVLVFVAVTPEIFKYDI
jgi:hypothetical protein